MPYCTASDVRMLVTTNLTDAQLTSLIALSDAELDDALNGAVMNDGLLKACSMRLTAIAAGQQQRTEANNVGGPSIAGYSVMEWQKFVDGKVAKAKVADSRWLAVDPLTEM